MSDNNKTGTKASTGEFTVMTTLEKEVSDSLKAFVDIRHPGEICVVFVGVISHDALNILLTNFSHQNKSSRAFFSFNIFF